MKKQLRVESNTGCVHIVKNSFKSSEDGVTEYSTLCSDKDNFTNEHCNKWKSTKKETTCFRCLDAYRTSQEQTRSLEV